MLHNSSKPLMLVILILAVGGIGILETQLSLSIETKSLKGPLIPAHQTSLISVSNNTLYADSLSPGSSRSYTIDSPEKSLLMLYVKTHTRDARLDLRFQGSGGRTSVAFPSFPEGVEGYFYYVNTRCNVNITITNLEEDKAVSYSFFLDLSSPLKDRNVKRIPLEGCPVAFHVDLKKDDEISINFPSEGSIVKAECYSLYYIRERRFTGYILKPYAKSSEKTLKFTADLGGRYYIIAVPSENVESLTITSILISPVWNQEWFWPTASMLLIAVSSWLSVTKIRNLKISDKAAKYTLFSVYFAVLTMILFFCTIGAYDYGNFASPHLMVSSILAYGLSLAIQVYAAYLSRKSYIVICPYCYKKVDLEESSFCCGRRIHKVSQMWYLAPAAFSLLLLLLFYSISYFALISREGTILELKNMPFWMGGAGCVLGGIVSWWINRKVEKKKSRLFLIVGFALGFFFPLLMIFLVEVTGIFKPVFRVEVFPQAGVFRLLVRMNVLPTVPFGLILGFTALAALLSYMLFKQVKMAISRDHYAKIPKNDGHH